MQINLGANLGASLTGLAIGYRINNINNTVYQAFTTTNVVETAILGTYIVTTSVTVPDSGAIIIFGVSDTDYALEVINPVTDTSVINNKLDTIDDFLDTEISAIQARINLLPTKTEMDSAIASIASILAANQTLPIENGKITIHQSNTFDATLTGLSIPSSWTSIVFTLKRENKDILDSSARLQIKVSNPSSGSDGLKILNGSTSVTANDANLIINQLGGTVAIHIENDITGQLDVRYTYHYDVKIYYGTSDSLATAKQLCVIKSAITLGV